MSQETQIAASILKRAVELDMKKRFTEAIICYQEGLQVLLTVVQNNSTSNEDKHKLRNKFEEYLSRVEKLKDQVELEKSENSFHEQIIIEENSCNHSYQSIFGRFLNQFVTEIEIDDPYIRIHHQCQNFLRFCELSVKFCENLKCISLTTIENNVEQKKSLKLMQDELLSRFKINLIINYSTTLHDREIRLNNGWVIKIGRGLDYFKGPDTKFSLGTHDLDLRKCHETTVDIFHKKDLLRSYR
ncbi:hypothetical protein PGB90_010238 [Kerria lacca]